MKYLDTYRKDWRAKRYFQTVFRNSPVHFEGDRSVVRKKPTNLSRFLNDAVAYCGGGADVSMIAPSSVRTSLFPGKLTEGDIANVSPFMNENAIVSVATVTGSQLAEIVAFSEKKSEGKDPFLYFSDALKKSEDGILKLNGVPVDPTKTYRVAGVYWLFNEVLGKKYPCKKMQSGPSPYYIAHCLPDYAKSYQKLNKEEEFFAKYTLPPSASADKSGAAAVSVAKTKVNSIPQPASPPTAREIGAKLAK